MSLKNLFALLFSTIMLITISACQSQAKSEQEKNQDKKDEAGIPVTVKAILRGNINAVYNTTTTLEAREEAMVVSKSGGIITDIYVEEGDVVKKAAVLAKTDKEEHLRLEMKRSQANLDILKNQLTRTKTMYRKKLVSEEAYEKLALEYKAEQANFDLANLNYKDSIIRAPIAGTISKRMIKAGNMVIQNANLFTITQLTILEAKINIPEKDLNKIAVNQQATLKIDALNQQLHHAKVARISPVIDSQSGTFKITLAIENTQLQLKPGMFARVNIQYDTHTNTLLIPKTALVYQDNLTSVYIAENNKAQQRNVNTGFENDQLIEITNGLKDEDMIIIAGQNSLKNNSKIAVIKP